MLQKKDYDFLNTISNTSIIILKNPVQELIISYEKYYKMNSFNALNCNNNVSKEFAKWKELILEFIRLNGDINCINTITPIIYCGIPIQSNSVTKKIVDVMIDPRYNNSIVVISCKNPLYIKLISKLNFSGRMILLFTDNQEDFDLDFSNLICVYSSTPNKMVADFSTQIFLSSEMPYNEIQNNYKLYQNKIIYIY